jgi:hypothetical protein
MTNTVGAVSNTPFAVGVIGGCQQRAELRLSEPKAAASPSSCRVGTTVSKALKRFRAWAMA